MFRLAAASACAAAACLMSGCLTQDRLASNLDPVDTVEIAPNGSRRNAVPRVAYRTHDSVVNLEIVSVEGRDPDWYWIYRNDEILPRPIFAYSDEDGEHFRFSDSLREAGAYTYRVRFGYLINLLSAASPAFSYFYPGRSPSGAVSLAVEESQSVRVDLSLPARAIGSQARFDRRVGPDGAVGALGTVPLGGEGTIRFVDRDWVPLDTVLYYRAAIRDAATEEWLDPTAWDSLRVFNRTWGYVPKPEFSSLGTSVEASISNPLSEVADSRVFYYLYRGRDAVRADGIVCDSVPAVGSPAPLRDAHPDTGTWVYWVDARDFRGRISPRSVPEAIRVSGIPIGPAIERIVVNAGVVRVSIQPREAAAAYVLQRAADTSGLADEVDTLTATEAANSSVLFDVPPGPGFWYYRVHTLSGTGRSAPGPWSQSEYFRPEQAYTLLDVKVRNRGPAGVAAELPLSAEARGVLYRSSDPDGADSVAVDSIGAPDPTGILADKPTIGVWYYRVYRFERPSFSGNGRARTAWIRIDYSGKAVGPTVLSLEKLGTGIDVHLEPDAEAIAYIVERRADTSQTWAVIDTLGVSAASALVYGDHPPRDGIWHYRARTLAADLVATDPGPELGTGTPWVFRVAYENLLQASVHNRGDRVECPLTTSASYGYFLKRGRTADYADPATVDSSVVGEGDAKVADTPPHGIWYYWLERRISVGVNSRSILRSTPVRVEFSGAPEIISLGRAAGGIAVEYPIPDWGDTLEVWRSTDSPEDTAAYERVRRETYAVSGGRWTDTVPSTAAHGIYHYRIAWRSVDRYTGMGPVKSFYFDGP